MQFQTYDLGYLAQGRVVQIQISGDAPNVRLMDDFNFSRYRQGRECEFVGGIPKRTIVRLATSHSGHWHVAIDFLGLRGSARTACQVLPN